MKIIMKKIGFVFLGILLINCAPEVSEEKREIYEEDPTIWDDSFTYTGIEPDWDEYDGRRITVNPSIKFQEIKGFAAADAWTGAFVGEYWNEGIKQEIADYFFSQEADEKGQPKGIGLSMWRVNLGAGSYEQFPHGRIKSNHPPLANGITWDHTRLAESYLADINNPAAGYNWEKGKGHQYWMREAKKRGLEHLVAAVFSPGVPWTITGVATNITSAGTAGGWDGNLTETGYTAFPAYLADVANHFAGQSVADNYGNTKNLRFDYISPVNEPQFSWSGSGGIANQEGSPFSNANITRIVKALDAAIQDPLRANISPANTKIIVAEASSWIPSYGSGGGGNEYVNARDQMNAFFNPSNAATYIGNLPSVPPVFVGHTYWTHENDALMLSHRQQLRTRADQFDIEVWNTEWCGLGFGWEWPYPNHAGAPSWYVALFMAKLIHTDLTIANLTSWSFWTAMDIEGSLRNHYNLIGIAPGSNVYDPMAHTNDRYVNQSGSIKVQSNLWTLGNYSLFVRPGFRRINVASTHFGTEFNDTNGFMVSAYVSPDGYKDAAGNDVDRIVMVYVNYTNSPRTVAAQFADNRKPTRIRCYLTNERNTNNHPARTDGRNGMRRMEHENGAYSVPAKSVVTIVYDFNQE